MSLAGLQTAGLSVEYWGRTFPSLRFCTKASKRVGAATWQSIVTSADCRHRHLYRTLHSTTYIIISDADTNYHTHVPGREARHSQTMSHAWHLAMALHTWCIRCRMKWTNSDIKLEELSGNKWQYSSFMTEPARDPDNGQWRVERGGKRKNWVLNLSLVEVKSATYKLGSYKANVYSLRA